MDRWKYWDGKKVFIILKNKRQYTGRVIAVDDGSYPLVYITIIDKFGNRVQFVHSEIDMIQEERR
jgi:hypothetical protein